MRLQVVRFLISAAAMLGAFLPAAPQQAGGNGMSNQEWIAYTGTYTGPKSQGIYSFRLAASGKVTSTVLEAATSNPSFLAESESSLSIRGK